MGTIKTTNIEPIADNGTVTLGSSGDTFTVPSGVTITNNGTQTGFGGTNTPAFEAYLGSTVTPSDATWTKVAMNTEVFDTASAYDHSSNYRFTVPSGQGGKYYVYAMLQAYATYDANAFSKIAIYKNGTAFVGTTKDSRNNNTRIAPMKVSSTMVLSASDYIEVFGYVDATSGNPEFSATSNGGDGGYYGTRWGAYKIIE
jgi:hypothetical protein